MTDAELAVAAASGDREAFAAMYDRYADRLHDFCHSLLRDRHEAADAMQDTFVRAAERLHQLRDPERLRAWLFAIARHESLRRLRHRSRAVPTEEIADMAAPVDAGAIGQGAEGEDLRRIVWDAAEGLVERDRVVLDLHLRQGLEGAELGDAIGVSENNAWVLMHRVRERLERALGALLVARKGRDHCPELQEVLAGWDGTFSPLIRKRVARHVEKCEVCGRRKAALASPLALLATVPLIPAPADLRDRVLGRVQLVSQVSGPGGWQRNGFPPPMGSDRGPARGLVWRAAAVVVVALLLGGLLVWMRDSDSPVEVAAQGAGADEAATTVAPLTGADSATTSAGGASETTPTTRRPRRPTTTVGTPGGGNGDGTTTTRPTTTTTRPTTTTTTAPDTTGPTIGTISAGPGLIRENDGEGCVPTTSTVSVSVSDPSGVTSVTLSWSVGASSGSKAMSGTGTYSASVGPFTGSTIGPSPGTAAVALTVTAKDGAGNTSPPKSSSGVLTLENCDYVS